MLLGSPKLLPWFRVILIILCHLPFPRLGIVPILAQTLGEENTDVQNVERK